MKNTGRTALLDLVGTVQIPATTGKFVAKKKFVVNNKHHATLSILAIWDEFDTWFLLGEGKTEDPITKQTLRYHDLRRNSSDGLIIKELGGEAKAETTMSEMFILLDEQHNGEDGALLNNGGSSNVFYVKCQHGVLRAMDIRWSSGGFWDIVARRIVCGPISLCKGGRVFSRNPALKSSEPSALVQV